MHFPHYRIKIRGAYVKIAIIFFQSFRHSRPINYFCLVITLYTAARKPRDAAAIPVHFHCHVVAFHFPVPMSTMSTFRPSPHRCVVFLVTCCSKCIKNAHSAAFGFREKANALSAVKRHVALNYVIISHAHTVVWECCKDDHRSQWGMAKFDP